MNPYGTQRPTYDAAAIEALYAQTQQSIDEYAAVPVAACCWPECTQLGLIEAGFCREHAHYVGLCRRCQSRKHEVGRFLCWTCARQTGAAAVARMRRRRRGGVA